MNVMDVARSLGVVDSNGAVAGTIDQQKVLGALLELTENDPTNIDLFGAVAERVQLARSAGLEVHDVGSAFGRPSDTADADATTTQLRYRSEMAELFTDLAIDVGLRHHRELVAAV